MSARQKEQRAKIKLNQPFAKAVEKLRRDALSRDDYDPAQLFAWGQMMAISVLEMHGHLPLGSTRHQRTF